MSATQVIMVTQPGCKRAAYVMLKTRTNPIFALVISAQPRVTSFRDLMHEAEEESDEEEGQRYVQITVSVSHLVKRFTDAPNCFRSLKLCFSAASTVSEATGSALA